MSLALLFLILGLLSAAIAFVLYAALSNDPAPSMSGYLPLLIAFGIAAPCLLVLALLIWIASVTMAVL